MIIDSLSISPELVTGTWPYTVPAVAQIAAEGLRLRSPVTVLMGPNGSGKSTIVEAVAEAYGIDVRGGHGVRRYDSVLPPGPLGGALHLRRGGLAVQRAPARAEGYFFRGETATTLLEYMSDYYVPGYGARRSDEVSRGESYLQVVDGRFGGPGLYLLDEAEGPLSFESTLILLHVLLDAVRQGGAQVICATHSPLVAALPGARIFELGDDGITPARWDELAAVGLWRRFLHDPAPFFAR